MDTEITHLEASGKENLIYLNPYQRAMRRIEENRKRRFNAIPFHFYKIEDVLPGVERDTYSIITANTGVGKTQITDYMALHRPIEQVLATPNDIQVKIFYFSLEMSAPIKAMQVLAHHHFVKNGGLDLQNNGILTAPRIGLKTMQSIFEKKRLTDKQLDELKSYEKYFEWFYSVVDMEDGALVPYQIYKKIRNWFHESGIGKVHMKNVKSENYNKATGEVSYVDKEVFDYYEYNEEYANLFVIVIVDHAALIKQQADKDTRESMTLLSQHLMSLRNAYQASVFSINQQMSSQEAKDEFKRPTLSGLGDNKAVGRDVDYVLGLYDPVRNDEQYCNNWNMQKMNGRFRELSILKSRHGASNIRTNLFYDGTTECFWQLDSDYDEYWYDIAKKLSLEM